MVIQSVIGKPLKPALTILFIIVLLSGCIRTGKESTSVKPHKNGSGFLDQISGKSSCITEQNFWTIFLMNVHATWLIWLYHTWKQTHTILLVN